MANSPTQRGRGRPPGASRQPATEHTEEVAAERGSSAARSLAVLQRLATAGRPLSLAELSQALDLPKATVHRLCAQLLTQGWLARDVDEREFVAGPALRRLALDVLNHDAQRSARHLVLADLVAQIGETCNFTTLDGARVLYLDRVEAPWPLRLTLDVGAHVPLHCTASGKLFLATLPATRRDALIDQLELTALTPHTLVQADALRRECDAIARRGYSTDGEEFVAGLAAVAVPVRDSEGRVRAAMAVHAPVMRTPLEKLRGHLPALQRAALRMETLL